ncbi:DUF3024 domain-containing protein [Rhodococcus sp. 2H158]
MRRGAGAADARGIAARHLTIVGRRAPWRADLGSKWTSLPVARLRYTETTKTLTLYWRDRTVRFHALRQSPEMSEDFDKRMRIPW